MAWTDFIRDVDQIHKDKTTARANQGRHAKSARSWIYAKHGGRNEKYDPSGWRGNKNHRWADPKNLPEKGTIRQVKHKEHPGALIGGPETPPEWKAAMIKTLMQGLDSQSPADGWQERFHRGVFNKMNMEDTTGADFNEFQQTSQKMEDAGFGRGAHYGQDDVRDDAVNILLGMVGAGTVAGAGRGFSNVLRGRKAMAAPTGPVYSPQTLPPAWRQDDNVVDMSAYLARTGRS